MDDDKNLDSIEPIKGDEELRQDIGYDDDTGRAGTGESSAPGSTPKFFPIPDFVQDDRAPERRSPGNETTENSQG